MKRLKGINTDVDPIDQPQGSYRDAKNAVIKRRIGAISSEGGTVAASAIPANHEVLGDTFIHDGRIIIFSRNSSTGFSEIGEFNGTTYTKILNDDDVPTTLNFQAGSYIDATSIINPDEEAIIYWTDDVNPPRFYNIDSQPTVVDVNDLDIFAKIKSATELTLDTVNQSGGALETGTYYFALAYIDQDDTITNFVSLTTGINIIDDIYTIQDASVDGAEAGTPTSRSITLSINNLDQNYQRALLVAIPQKDGVFGTPKILPEISFSSTTTSFTYTGQETFIEGSLDEVIINKVNYLTAKTIDQIDGVLYMGNLTQGSDVGYQKFANNIKTEPVVKRFDAETGVDTQKNETFVYLNKSFQRDEVYAFYISMIKKDGTETPAYHIPGRAPVGDDNTRIDALTAADYTNEILSIDPDAKKFHFLDTEDATTGMQYWENANESYPDIDDFDVFDVNASGDPVAITTGTGNGLRAGVNVRHHHFPTAGSKPFYNDAKSQTGELLGVKFSDVKIPTNILDEIVAVKFYYAKRTNQNKRIIDQATLHPTELNGEDLIVNDITTTVPNSETGTVVSTRPFRLMREQGNIGAITHLKNIATPQLSDQSNFEFWDGSATDGDDWTITDADLIRQVESKAYVPSNIDEVELISKGFENNADTYKEESKILLELINPLQVGTVDYAGVNKMQFLSNLCSHKVDVYNSFDQQELVWTGILETNLERFDPSGTYSGNPDAGKAAGSIDVLTGTNDVGTQGTGTLEITSERFDGYQARATIGVEFPPLGVGPGNDFYYEFDFYGVVDIQTATLTQGTATTEDCANAIAFALNSNATISADWTATVFGHGDGTYGVSIVADNVGTAYNGEDLTNDIVFDVTASAIVPSDLDLSDFPTHDGLNAATSEDVEPQVGTFIGNTITILNTDTLTEIATKVADAINASANLADLTATASGTTVTVTTIDNTSGWNGRTIDLVSTYVQDTEGTITGGNNNDTFEVAFLIKADVYASGGYYKEMTISSNRDAITVASIIENELSTDTNITDFYEISVSGTTISLLSKGFTSDYNGTITQVDVATVDVTSSATVQAPEAASDSEAGPAFNLEWLGFNFSVGYDLTYSLGPADPGMNSMSVAFQESSTKEVWTQISIASQDPAGTWDSPADDYTATIGGGVGSVTGPWIRGFITGSCSNGFPAGAEGDGSIRVQQTTGKDSGGVTSTIVNLTGASSALQEAEFGESLNNYNGDTFIGLYGERLTENNTEAYVAYYPVESMDNIMLRHQGNAYGEVYYPKTDYQTIVDLEANDNEDSNIVWYDNPYLYNVDYSSVGTIKSTFPYPKNYEEDVNFPTRIIRSASGADNNPSFENFREFLVNDFLDLPRNRGELVMLSSTNDSILIPHMERGLFMTKGREELTTGDIRAFVGSGDIFSVRPDEISYTREGRGGLQDPKSAIVTPYGYFFVDRDAGKIYLLGEGLNDISANGLSNFFFDELRDAPENAIVAGYDNDEERIMITYKDNWTISFYPDLMAWVSFHDYNPEYYLSDLNGFYTLKNDLTDRNIYTHNIETDPGNFYGTLNPLEFDFVDNREPTATKRYQNIEYIAEVQDGNNVIYNETFNKFRVFNKRQDSGEKDIVYFTGANGNARNVEDTWKINNFRNMLVNGVVDPNKPWQDQDRFVSKHLQVRLIFNNSGQKSIYLYDATTSAQLSNR